MNTEDRELLELAAKAAGLPVEFKDEDGGDVSVNGWFPCGRTDFGDVDRWWNPLEDDGDALRLSVSLSIRVNPPEKNEFGYTSASAAKQFACSHVFVSEKTNGDPMKSMRRAIVRAAAEIGRRIA